MQQRERVLFICYGNIHRSVTAEELYRDDPRYEVMSRGTAEHAKRRITQQDIQWADKIFVMNRIMEIAVRRKAGISNPEVVDLSIPDVYDTTNPEEKEALKKELKEKLAPFLGEPKTE